CLGSTGGMGVEAQALRNRAATVSNSGRMAGTQRKKRYEPAADDNRLPMSINMPRHGKIPCWRDRLASKLPRSSRGMVRRFLPGL
ncbi:hypothetical protein CEJ63_26390, partial [Acinetobacter baumannii]